MCKYSRLNEFDGLSQSTFCQAVFIWTAALETILVYVWMLLLSSFVAILQVRYLFSRKRRMFGARCKFSSTQCSEDSDTSVNISSVPGINLDLQRMERDIGVQVINNQ